MQRVAHHSADEAAGIAEVGARVLPCAKPTAQRVVQQAPHDAALMPDAARAMQPRVPRLSDGAVDEPAQVAASAACDKVKGLPNVPRAAQRVALPLLDREPQPPGRGAARHPRFRPGRESTAHVDVAQRVEDLALSLARHHAGVDGGGPRVHALAQLARAPQAERPRHHPAHPRLIGLRLLLGALGRLLLILAADGLHAHLPVELALPLDLGRLALYLLPRRLDLGLPVVLALPLHLGNALRLEGRLLLGKLGESLRLLKVLALKVLELELQLLEDLRRFVVHLVQHVAQRAARTRSICRIRLRWRQWQWRRRRRQCHGNRGGLHCRCRRPKVGSGDVRDAADEAELPAKLSSLRADVGSR